MSQTTVAINGRPQSNCGRAEPVFADEEYFFRGRRINSDALRRYDEVAIARIEEYDEVGAISLLEMPVGLCDALLYMTHDVLVQLPDLLQMGCGKSTLRREPNVTVIAVTENQCASAARYAYSKLIKVANQSLVNEEYDGAWSAMDLALRANFNDDDGRQWQGSIFMGAVVLARGDSSLGDVSRCFEAFALHRFGESRHRSWLSYVERWVEELSLRRRIGTIVSSGSIGSIGAVPIEAVPIGAVPIEAVPIEAVPIEAVPIEAVPIGAVPIEANPIGWPTGR